jgi:hypothetical protein
MILKQVTVFTRMFFMLDSADHRSGKTGLTVTVTLSKAGAAFAAAGGAVSEVASGWYKIVLSAVDTNTVGQLVYHCTATGADPRDFDDEICAKVFTDLLLDASGAVTNASNIKKNQVLNGFTFLMTDAINHAPATSVLVTATRSLNGAAFAPCANSPTVVSNGLYAINLAAADTNANTVTLRFTATGCDDLIIELITVP